MALPSIRRNSFWMSPFGENLADINAASLFPDWPAINEEAISPSIDLSEKDGELLMTVELPGINRDDINLSIDNGVVTISGKKESSREEEQADYYLRESSYGAFSRSIRLPSEVDEEKAEAKFEDGVLKLTLPKIEESQSKRIQIK